MEIHIQNFNLIVQAIYVVEILTTAPPTGSHRGRYPMFIRDNVDKVVFQIGPIVSEPIKQKI